MIGIEPLDRRAYRSISTVVDAGGLPRQLTAVGDVVYFAVDSKADGHLSYVDLAAYNVKTKARASIRRADGTRFGDVEYTLASVDNRLRITELLGKGKTAEWSLKPGDSKAKKYSAPKSPVSKKFATGFAATATPWTNRTAFASGAGVYTLNASTGKSYAVSVPFEKHLDHIASLGAVGDKLIVDAVHKEGEKLYVVDRTTGVGARYRPTKDAGDANFVRTVSSGALVQAKVNGVYQLFLTDGTTVGTTALTSTTGGYYNYTGIALTPTTGTPPATTLGYFDAKLLPSAEFVQADDHTLYFSNHAVTVDPTDPERAGPYVAPVSGTRDLVASGTITNLVVSVGPVPFDDRGIFKLDLTAKTLTTVSTSPTADGLTVVGDSLYYTVGIAANPDASNVYARSLHRLHLPSATDAYVSEAFEGAVYADGTPIVVTSGTATTLSTGTPDVGSLQVDVLRDDAHAKSLDGETRMSGFSFYLDRNHDGAYQKSEPLLRSQGYAVSFANLAAGKYDVRLRPVDGWTATRGWVKTVTVRGGEPNVTQFGLADDVKTGAITGTFKYPTAPRVVWIDADGDGVRDANERQTSTTAAGVFEFDGLIAGDYIVRRDGDSSIYYAAIKTPGERAVFYS